MTTGLAEFILNAYDAACVALSRRLESPLVTADRRLVDKFAGSGYDLRWLGDCGG